MPAVGTPRCFCRFLNTGAISDAAAAVTSLIEKVLLPGLPPEAVYDPNEFRQARMHTKQMEAAIKDHWDLLQAMFRAYKAKDRWGGGLFSDPAAV